MAIGTAPGYNNLAEGNWVPELFAAEAQLALRENSVVQMVTNTDYYGQIAESGNTVKILKEPNITVSSYVRGQKLSAQPLSDEEIVMRIDKANSAVFALDDIEEKQSHIDYMSLSSNRMGFEVANTMDKEVLQYAADNAGTNVNGGETDYSFLKIGSTSAPIDLVLSGQDNDTSFSALSLLNRFSALLEEQNVPSEERWFIGDPAFFEKLSDEDSKFLNADFVGTTGRLETGKHYQGMARGFALYQSNNLPRGGAGPRGKSNSDYGVVLAGHRSAIATAEQLNITETIRNNESFGDICRSLHLYGRHILREEALCAGIWHSAA